MNTHNVSVQGHDYVIGKLNAMDQFHITRRLAPMMANMGITAAQLKKLSSGKPTQDQILALLGPAVGTLSAMENDNVEYIIHKCMSVVHRVDSGKAQPVQAAPGRFMYDDIDMPVMLMLTYEVCKFNLQGFMSGLSGLINSPSS